MAAAERIRANLERVSSERARRSADSALAHGVQAVKAYQHARFRHSHADLLADPETQPAARFFFEEIYGPQDFSLRDAQFARIVPAIVRLFPDRVVATVDQLADLHALSEALDSEMALSLEDADALDDAAYGRVWRRTGRPADRWRQIELLGLIGRSLAGHTRSRMLLRSLRMMRPASKAAGLGELQRFLEEGFEAFASLRDPGAFLTTIEQRESAMIDALFSGSPAPS